MITLQSYLYGRGPEGKSGEDGFSRALANLATVLLGALETHAAADPHPRLDPIRADLRALRERLEGDATPEDVENAGAEAIRLLAQYRRTRDEIAQSNTGPSHRVVELLDESVAILAATGERSVARLRKVEDHLKQATTMHDLLALRAKLNDATQFVREECAREKEESSRALGELRRQARQAQEDLASARAGLAGRAEFEKTLEAAMVRRYQTSLAVIWLEHAAAIRKKRGASLADRLYHCFAQDLSKYLPSPKKLFRWNDAVLVAELATEASPHALRAEIRTCLAAIPPDRRLEVDSHSALVSNGHRWTLFPLSEIGSPAEAVRRIEQFVGE